MIRPIGNRLLVEPVKEAQTTAGGILLRDQDTLVTAKCEIVALGTDMKRTWEVGDIILVPKQSFIEARDTPTDNTVVISEDDVIAVVSPATA